QVKLAPEYTRTDNKSSAIVKSSVSPETNWLVRNFRLQINGLDCTSVDSIDALTISIDQRADAVGDARDYAKEPTTLNIPNLSFAIPESAAASLIAWHEDFVIRGNNSSNAEKSGALQLLSSNLQDVLFTLTFHNLGIFSLKKVDADFESTPRLRAEMYCEQIGLKYKSATALGTQSSSTNTSSGTSKGSINSTLKVVVPPLRGTYVQGLTKMAGPITRQTQPSPTLVNALDLGRPLRFRS